MTRSPSVTGEAAQYGLVAWVTSLSTLFTPDCQSNFPSFRSKHINVRRLSFSTDCVTKMRLPQTMGVEFPRSGNGVRQRMFSFVVQRSGRFVSGERPVPD